jgi:predicted DNA-binding antitoxin AbrB/MazE fold protein
MGIKSFRSLGLARLEFWGWSDTQLVADIRLRGRTILVRSQNSHPLTIRFSPQTPDTRVHPVKSSHIDPEQTLDLRAGELVEVRSADEILATLDQRGELDSLPFMPEMTQYCGRQFRVSKRADTTCDTIEKYHARRMYRTVHLEQLRCDGCGHDDCQAGCLTFWKEAWLKRSQVKPDGVPLVQIRSRSNVNGSADAEAKELSDLLARASRTTDEKGVRYSCQATELLRASEPLPWWGIRRYLREIVTRNISPAQFFRGYWFSVYAIVRRKLGRPPSFPFMSGKLKTTPTEQLNLQPGELVQVKSRREIYETLDGSSKNRGLFYDVEMWRFSGGTFRVLRRVDHIVNEKDGRMIKLPGGCVILDGVYCSGERSTHRLFCQRNIFSFWREIWLRRVS